MNNVFLIGRLTKDVELRYTQTNLACANIDLAINNGKDKDDNDRPADFIRVVTWEKQAENLAKYCKKGSQVAVSGSLKEESWEDEQGNKKYKTYVLARRVMFLDSSKRSEEPLPQTPDYLTNQTTFTTKQLDEMPFPEVDIDDSQLPF